MRNFSRFAQHCRNPRGPPDTHGADGRIRNIIPQREADMERPPIAMFERRAGLLLMTSINNIDSANNTRPAAPVARVNTRAAASPVLADQTSRNSDSVDQVQLSDHARWLDRLRDLPVRSDLVNRIKAEIDSGAYDIDARLDHAAKAIADDLAG